MFESLRLPHEVAKEYDTSGVRQWLEKLYEVVGRSLVKLRDNLMNQVEAHRENLRRLESEGGPPTREKPMRLRRIKFLTDILRILPSEDGAKRTALQFGGETTMAKKDKKKSGGFRTSRVVGRTMGLGKQATYAAIFERNERVPRAKKMTDEEIAKFMCKEFPDAISELTRNPAKMHIHRNFYNANHPGKVSYPYDEDGNPVMRGSGYDDERRPSKKGKDKSGKKKKQVATLDDLD